MGYPNGERVEFWVNAGRRRDMNRGKKMMKSICVIVWSILPVSMVDMGISGSQLYWNRKVGGSTIRGWLGYGEKKGLKFLPNNLKNPGCGLVMGTVFAIGQNARIMFGPMILFTKELVTTGPFVFWRLSMSLPVRAWARLWEDNLLRWMWLKFYQNYLLHEDCPNIYVQIMGRNLHQERFGNGWTI